MLGGVADVVLPTENALRDLYELKGPLAGAHSRSVEARHIETGITFALREFHMAELTTTRLAQLRAAVTAWRKLDNPADEEAARFPRLHEVLASPTRLHVVCEISGPPGCCPVDLHTLIEQRGRLAEADARQIYARLVLAVKAAHDVGIALRSIKPETIQVWQPPAGGWEVALCDLFCAATVDETEEDGNSLRGLCGTPEFCAPEVVLFFWADRMAQPPPAYGPMADIWALGICLHVMLCGCLPFDTSQAIAAAAAPSARPTHPLPPSPSLSPSSLSHRLAPGTSALQPEEDMLREINAANFDFDDPGWAKISSDGRELVKTLLARDARDRLTVYGVLQHPFCAEDVNLAINTSRVSRLQSADFDQALNLLDDDE